jgi:hypothetical protein
MVATVAALIAVGVYFSGPYTYAAEPVYVSNMELAQYGADGLMVESARRDVERRHGADFSLILAPAKEAPTRAMQTVATTCLPVGASPVVLVKRLHPTYQHATDYLLCAMSKHKERLCESAERKRLAAQLLQFKERRQNVLGYERALAALVSTPAAAHAAAMFTAIDDGIREDAAPRRPKLQSIGEDMDQRVVDAIAALNREGYLTASDFSRFGLFLPSEYAAALDKSEAGSPPC